MAKLCLFHLSCASPLRLRSPFPAWEEVLEIVPPEHCERCAEAKAYEARRWAEMEADWQREKIWFVQHMNQIPRGDGWKQRVLDALLEPN